MIVGTVTAEGDATIYLSLRGPGGSSIDIECVVDTGFNDWLSLTPSVIRTLGLVLRESVRFVLADGSEGVARVFAGEVHWLGQWRRVFVLETDGEPLVGMALMRGCRLLIDVIDGGSVEIQPLPLL